MPVEATVQQPEIPPPPEGPPSRARKWLFRLAAVILVLVLPLGGLEAALRLVGYGFHSLCGSATGSCETLRLEPGNKFAPDYLAQVRATKSRTT